MALKPATLKLSVNLTFKQVQMEVMRTFGQLKDVKSVTYAGLRVSNKVRRICITLTIADSFLSFSKMLASSCSTVSCLKKRVEGKMKERLQLETTQTFTGGQEDEWMNE